MPEVLDLNRLRADFVRPSEGNGVVALRSMGARLAAKPPDGFQDENRQESTAQPPQTQCGREMVER
jgi:hypothetical protein